MRPVNLIPADERRGDSAPLRTGNLVYVLVAGLGLLLLGVLALALTSKQVSDRKAEKASLEQQLQQDTARANSLAAFASFRAVQESRAATLTSLAQSRFDWPRVLHELSLVLPDDIQLTLLTGSVSSESSAQSTGSSSSSSGGSGGGSSLRGEIAGPALEIGGCATTQDAVAAFVSALGDIDGVTRVGLSSSAASGSVSSSSAGGSGDCPTGMPYAFQVVAGFDAVATPPTASTAPSVPPTVSPGSGSDASQVAETKSQENVARTSARVQISKAQKAKALLPGG